MSPLRPHDVAVALQLCLTPDAPFAALAQAVGLSQGEAHNAVKRLGKARLLRSGTRQVNRHALLDFLTSGVPYVFATEPGPETLGVPTAHAAPPLADEFRGAPPVVWPSVDGTVRGESVEPLYPGAVKAASRNEMLHGYLALVDALRIGRARERRRARAILARELDARDAGQSEP